MCAGCLRICVSHYRKEAIKKLTNEFVISSITDHWVAVKSRVSGARLLSEHFDGSKPKCFIRDGSRRMLSGAMRKK